MSAVLLRAGWGCESGAERPKFKRGESFALHTAMCRLLCMPTNLAIDDELLEEALRIGGQRTKKDTVNAALREYIQRRRQAKIVDIFGKVEFAPDYDHKKQRRRP
jgi:Arc/MetJ family transcription regulator